MNNNLENFKAWAPHESIWSQWVKPVLFMQQPTAPSEEFTPPQLDWNAASGSGTMYIVDLPGKESIESGLALVGSGYRPIPLYNGVKGPNQFTMLVDVDPIIDALHAGAGYLKSCNLSHGAAPAFLLDSKRMDVLIPADVKGKFDNRWCLYPQDMPSASFLIINGINRIVVRTNMLLNDLSYILYAYQKAGIAIFLSFPGQELQPANLLRPSFWQTLKYRWDVMMKYKPSGVGGFGEHIPAQIVYVSNGYRSSYRHYRGG